jgi:CubicO group peptidase (beta-lactamase class C family)
MKHMIYILHIIFVFSFLITVYGQDNNIRPLDATENSRYEADLGATDVHKYSINLRDNRFVYLRVAQKGIDVLVKVFDPQENLVGDYDSPTGASGVEEVIFIAETAGKYMIEIHPYDPLTKPGKYILLVDRDEEAATGIEDKIRQLFVPWDKNDSPGAAVAVVKEGEIIYKNGFGMANLEYGIKITSTSVFHMASVSKQFTAYAIAVLDQQGKLSVSDDIRKYIPEVPDFGAVITIDHLIHHTSGLRDQWNLLVMAGWRLDDVITKNQIMRLVERQKELNFAPGEEYLYCNTGYTLMAEIVARVSGKSFAEWTEENIFKPLGMTNTLFYDDHEKIVQNRAYSYQQEGDEGYKKSVLSYANVGATSLFTTAEDLSKWAMNFDEPIICDSTLIEQMETKGILKNGDTIVYAYGQGVGSHKGLKFIGHSGGDAGYRTYLGRFPDQKFAVMVMSNLGDFNPSGIALHIADMYLDDLIIPEPNDDGSPEFETVEVNPSILEKYAGLYQPESGDVITVIRDGLRLLVQVQGRPRSLVYATSETEFSSRNGLFQFSFELDSQGMVKHMLIIEDEQQTIAPRVEPFSLSADGLREYTGTFYSDGLDTRYYIELADSILVVKHQRHDDFSLEPQSKDIFSGTWFFGRLQFERNSEGNISGFRVNSGRVRNLLFTRLEM